MRLRCRTLTMIFACNCTFILRFFLFHSFIMSTALSAVLILPPSINANRTLAPSLGNPLNLTSPTRCILPAILPLLPANREICAPAFAKLLSRRDVDVAHKYTRDALMPQNFTYAHCTIGLDRDHQGSDAIRISIRQIIGSATRTLALCHQYGQGGWEYIAWHSKWIIFIEGA